MNKKKLVREHFRTEVFTRDKYKCRVCNESPDKLDAHHITNRNLMIGGGYVKENGITLCPDCHIFAEAYPRGIKVIGNVPFDYSPKNLYILIGSSYELAVEKSKL